MRNFFLHFSYIIRQLLRQPNARVRLVLLVPVAQIMPILLMGSAFLSQENAEWFLYTNLAWGFVSSCALQALVWTQTVINTSRLDTLLLVDGGICGWLIGVTAGLNALYIASTCLSTLVIAFILNFPFQAVLIFVTLAASVPVSMGIIAFILGCELRWGRILHIVNTALDITLIMSGVLYPVMALGAVVGTLAQVFPTTQLNEYLRGGPAWHLIAALALAFMFAGVGMVWVRQAVRRYRVTGLVGG